MKEYMFEGGPTQQKFNSKLESAIVNVTNENPNNFWANAHKMTDADVSTMRAIINSTCRALKLDEKSPQMKLLCDAWNAAAVAFIQKVSEPSANSKAVFMQMFKQEVEKYSRLYAEQLLAAKPAPPLAEENSAADVALEGCYSELAKIDEKKFSDIKMSLLESLTKNSDKASPEALPIKEIRDLVEKINSGKMTPKLFLKMCGNSGALSFVFNHVNPDVFSSKPVAKQADSKPGFWSKARATAPEKIAKAEEKRLEKEAKKEEARDRREEKKQERIDKKQGFKQI